MIGVLVKMIICGFLARVIVIVLRHVKIEEYLDIKNFFRKKHLFSELGLNV